MALKSLLKVEIVLERWGKGKEESSGGAGIPSSDPGFDANCLCLQGRAFASLGFLFSHLDSGTHDLQIPPR